MKNRTKKLPLMVPVRKGRDDMTDWDEREGRWAKNIYNDEGNERHHVTKEKLPSTVCVVYGNTEKQVHARAQFIEDAINQFATLRQERDELRAELLTTHQMACRVGLERDELAVLSAMNWRS